MEGLNPLLDSEGFYWVSVSSSINWGLKSRPVMSQQTPYSHDDRRESSKSGGLVLVLILIPSGFDWVSVSCCGLDYNTDVCALRVFVFQDLLHFFSFDCVITVAKHKVHFQSYRAHKLLIF